MSTIDSTGEYVGEYAEKYTGATAATADAGVTAYTSPYIEPEEYTGEYTGTYIDPVKYTDQYTGKYTASTVEYPIAAVIRQFLAPLMAVSPLPVRILRILRHIRKCRTEIMGGRQITCTVCGVQKTVWNSCGNRNCPTCQSIKKEMWIDKRMAQLLPVKHFHVIFTLPHELNALMLQNQSLLYGGLFRCAWRALSEAASDPKILGARTGMIAAVHTWGSNLSLHPHLHCIVPAGGLDGDGAWKDCKKGGHFFVRFSEISAMFRRYYLDFLVECWEEGHLDFGSDPAVQALAGRDGMRAFILQLRKKRWNLRIEKPMSAVQQVVNYLGRYIYRTAITNSRILEITEKTVRFTVKDYAASTDTTKPAVEKELKLTGVEFLRRFVRHILPPSFQRVRYYGFYAGAAKTKLENAKKKIGNRDWCYTLRTVVQIITAMIGCEPEVCPCCGARGQWLVEIIPAPYRSKPPVVAAQRGPPAGPGSVSGCVSVP